MNKIGDCYFYGIKSLVVGIFGLVWLLEDFIKDLEFF